MRPVGPVPARPWMSDRDRVRSSVMNRGNRETRPLARSARGSGSDQQEVYDGSSRRIERSPDDSQLEPRIKDRIVSCGPTRCKDRLDPSLSRNRVVPVRHRWLAIRCARLRIVSFPERLRVISIGAWSVICLRITPEEGSWMAQRRSLSDSEHRPPLRYWSTSPKRPASRVRRSDRSCRCGRPARPVGHRSRPL